MGLSVSVDSITASRDVLGGGDERNELVESSAKVIDIFDLEE